MRLSALLLPVVVYAVGCESAPPQPPPTPPPPPSPEAKFERFLSELRRRVDGDRLSPSSISSGNTTYAGGYRVTGHAITKPATEDGAYHARVTITEQASYSYLSPLERGPDDQPASTSPPSLEEDDDGNLILNPSGGKADRSLRAVTSPLKSHERADAHDFELSFVEGEWRLRTSIPPQRPFLAAAFRLALGRQ